MDKNYSFDTFQQAYKGMIKKSREQGSSYCDDYSSPLTRLKDYSLEEIERILNSGSPTEQRQLSYTYFNRDGFYNRIIMYYATLLTFSGLLVPNPSLGQQLSSKNLVKKYSNALNYVEDLPIKKLYTQMTIKILRDGCYYGLIGITSKNKFFVLDLPVNYCRSIYKDNLGNDIIEFNLTYFDTLSNEQDRAAALAAYPKDIRDAYNHYKKAASKAASISQWYRLDSETAVFYTFHDSARPLFLDIIPATIDYDSAVKNEQERIAEEIKKILVQKIPHTTSTGELVFEPTEAEEMHAGAVEMMSKNKNVSVLTTYADVDSIISNTANEGTINILDKMRQNIYAKSGVSQLLFAPEGGQALKTSILNDISLMMVLANQYADGLTRLINDQFSNSAINFKYIFLPISYYNASDYISDSFKLAQSGYSWYLPSIAMGLSQRDLLNIKDLENDVDGLASKLIPLQSTYTTSANSGEVGKPEKELENKSDKTIQNIEAIDHQGAN